jgi:hypothetical protein
VFRFENVTQDGSEIAAQYVLADFLRVVVNLKIKLQDFNHCLPQSPRESQKRLVSKLVFLSEAHKQLLRNLA